MDRCAVDARRGACPAVECACAARHCHGTRAIRPAKSDAYAGQLCSGVRFTVTDPKALRTTDLFIRTAFVCARSLPADFQPRWEEILRVTARRDFETAYKAGKTPESLLDAAHKSADHFLDERKPYLLYGS